MSHQLDMGFEWSSTREMHDRAERLPDVSGLWYYPEFLTGFQQQKTIDRIDSLPWRNDLERRVQHYGWRYDYRARIVSRDVHLGPLPNWLQERFSWQSGLPIKPGCLTACLIK